MDITVTTRPVRPEDQPLFCRLWERLSPETVYRRFHAPVRALPDESVRRLVTVDHDAREAVVAVVGGEVVGVARYDRSPADPTAAEFAVVVEDDWQDVGLGRQLLTELTRLAAARGVRVLTATVQADNDRVLSLVRRLLPGAHISTGSGVCTVQAPLRATPPAPAVATAC